MDQLRFQLWPTNSPIQPFLFSSWRRSAMKNGTVSSVLEDPSIPRVSRQVDENNASFDDSSRLVA